MPVLPWYIWAGLELLKLLPTVIRAIKDDPNPSTKESAKTVVSRIKKATVGEETDLKGIQ